MYLRILTETHRIDLVLLEGDEHNRAPKGHLIQHHLPRTLRTPCFRQHYRFSFTWLHCQDGLCLGLLLAEVHAVEHLGDGGRLAHLNGTDRLLVGARASEGDLLDLLIDGTRGGLLGILFDRTRSDHLALPLLGGSGRRAADGEVLHRVDLAVERRHNWGDGMNLIQQALGLLVAEQGQDLLL